MKHIGLFEGIGGFSYAAQQVGWETVAWCEWDPFCQYVLRYHFPEATGYGDITKTDFTKYHGTIDIITGGFPCQPYSQAGKRLGKDDDRHLWPEMLRAIREVAPPWVVGENVFGLVNWNGGLVFEEVCDDLEAEGYEVQPYVLPAASVGAPHRRDRVWFVAYNAAYANSPRFQKEGAELSPTRVEQYRELGKTTSDANGIGLRGEGHGSREPGLVSQTHTANDWTDFPTQSPICGGDDGLSGRLDRVAILEATGSTSRSDHWNKWRSASLKGYGNAVVPEIPVRIFRAINEYCK